MTTFTRRARSQQGVSLLEVVVAMAIFSVGMLGMLSLLSNSVLVTRGASNASIAAQHAYAIADSARANIVSIGNFDDPDPADDATFAGCLTTAGCTGVQMLGTEYRRWLQLIGATLPQGTGIVCRDSTPGDGNPFASPPDWGCDGLATAPFIAKVCWMEPGWGARCVQNVI